ncbi:hypothetical protein SAMN04488490_0941 [Marinobacter sp. LV10R510-11A]|nr:hypothetical protein SAMN04488490_0941 [Marinobacter sp. LV10R510-11A]
MSQAVSANIDRLISQVEEGGKSVVLTQVQGNVLKFYVTHSRQGLVFC